MVVLSVLPRNKLAAGILLVDHEDVLQTSVLEAELPEPSGEKPDEQPEQVAEVAICAAVLWKRAGSRQKCNHRGHHDSMFLRLRNHWTRTSRRLRMSRVKTRQLFFSASVSGANEGK